MGTIIQVRRLLAAIVLSVIGLLPITGALSSSTVQVRQLPPCCRVHGKHQCALHLLEKAPAGSPVRLAISSVCGQYPFSQLPGFTAENVSVFSPKASALFHCATVSYLPAPFEGETRLSNCFERGNLKRGPPTFFS